MIYTTRYRLISAPYAPGPNEPPLALQRVWSVTEHTSESDGEQCGPLRLGSGSITAVHVASCLTLAEAQRVASEVL